MKLTIERAALLKALSHVQSVVERRTTIPILSNVLLRAEAGPSAGLLALSATDMDLEIVERVPGQVEREGRTTAPAHTLYDIVRKLPEGAQIEIETGGSVPVGGGLTGGPQQNPLSAQAGMLLRCGRSNFTLAALPPEDYPLMTGGDLPHNFTLSTRELCTLIDRTRFAISTEETRYYLNGIYLHATKSNEVPVIRAVATDGHRLARVEMQLPAGAAGMPGVIIPRKTVLELRKLIEEDEQEVEISLSETKIRFAIPGSTPGSSASLISKLIDGTFPDYDRVIPANNDKHLDVKCKEFAEAVDRVSTISTEKSRAVKLSIEGRSLTVSATSPENGTAVEEIEIDYGANPIEIGFNSRYLLDITDQIDGETAQIKMSDAASPTIVCDAGPDASGASALYVLMPMRV
ncbi:MAG TPA: DNA polymerase III subunit beta [Stellaceae bacterium]|nr:DNA polymerase III subunit beta [Stellaceae bacterium]